MSTHQMKQSKDRPQSMTQSRVEKRVREALAADPQMRDQRIDVIDNNGVITLQGEVRNAGTRQAAEEIAASPDNVIRVINDLSIASVQKPAGTSAEFQVKDLPNTAGNADDPEFPVKNLPDSAKGTSADPEFAVKDLPDSGQTTKDPDHTIKDLSS